MSYVGSLALRWDRTARDPSGRGAVEGSHRTAGDTTAAGSAARLPRVATGTSCGGHERRAGRGTAACALRRRRRDFPELLLGNLVDRK